MKPSFSEFVLSDACLLRFFDSDSTEMQEALLNVRWDQLTRQWISDYPVVSLENIRHIYVNFFRD